MQARGNGDSSGQQLLCGGAGFASYMDSNQVNFMGKHWLTPPASAFTIEYWIRIIDPYRAVNTGFNYAAWDLSVSPPYSSPYEVTIAHQSGNTYYYRDATGFSCDVPECQILNKADNPWHHFAYVADITRGNVLMYVNGVQVWNDTQPGTDESRPLLHGGLVSIGQTQYAVAGSFNAHEAANAIFDEYRIWSTARTPDEILTNYRIGVDENDPDLVMYHRWDQSPMISLSNGITSLGVGINDNDLSTVGASGDLQMGTVPGLKPFLTWTDTTRIAQLPSSPFMVISDAPVIGAGPLIVTINTFTNNTNEASSIMKVAMNTSFTLLAHDPRSTAAIEPLQYQILSLPSIITCGHIMNGSSSNDGSSGNGMILTAAHLPFNISIALLPTLLFIPSSSFIESSTNNTNDGTNTNECSLIYRVIQLTSPYQWCDSQVMFVPNIIRSPSDQSVTTNEGVPVVISLGSIGMDGERLTVIIQSLPIKGVLYHAMFDNSVLATDGTGDVLLSYDNLVMDTSLLTPIQIGQNLSSTIGGYSILIYAPESIGYSSEAIDHPRSAIPYASFTYSFIKIITGGNGNGNSNSNGYSISSNAYVMIDVIHMNHAPITNDVEPSPRLFDCNNNICGLQIPFSSVDNDITFSSTSYYRIKTFPLLGDLYQVYNISSLSLPTSSANSSNGNGIGSSSGTIIPILSVDDYTLITDSSSTTFSWAVSVMRVSSQYSNCGPLCYHPETCPSSCTNLDFAASHILGAYDWFPSYSDSPFNWNVAFPGQLDWIELDYGQLMYVTSIEVYETWITGGTVKISVASEYNHDDTEWITLWESMNGPSLPDTAARVFSPSLCPCLTPVRYLRLDIDSTYGWLGIDAVKMIGSTTPPAGQLLTHGIIYVPPKGITTSILHNITDTTNIAMAGDGTNSNNDNNNTDATTAMDDDMVMDTFSFTATDCLAEGIEPTIVPILPSLTPVHTQWITYNLIATPSVGVSYSLPLSDLHSFINHIAGKSSGSTVSFIGLQLINSSSSSAARARTDTPWLYSSLNNSRVLSNGDWLPYIAIDSSWSTSSISSVTPVKSLMIKIPLSMALPYIIFGAHIRVTESSAATITSSASSSSSSSISTSSVSTRSYTWMLRIRVNITLLCGNGMVLHPSLGICINCLILPLHVINGMSSVDRIVFLHNTCPLYGTLLCSSMTSLGVSSETVSLVASSIGALSDGSFESLNVPCVSPAVLSSMALNGILWLVIIILILLAVTAMAVMKWRRTRALYASSPLFLSIGLFIGGPLIMISVILLTRNPSIINCSAKNWTLHIGAILLLSSLSLKNYRLHYIFNRKVFAGWKKPPKDYQLLIALLLSLIPDVLLLTIWQLLSPYDSLAAAAGYCESQHSTTITILLYIVKVPWALICLYLGYSLRKLHAIFNESIRLRAIIFNIGIIGLPLAVLALVGHDYNGNTAVAMRIGQAICLLYLIVATIIIMLVPQLKAVRLELKTSSLRHKLTAHDNNMNNSHVSAPGGGGGHDKDVHVHGHGSGTGAIAVSPNGAPPAGVHAPNSGNGNGNGTHHGHNSGSGHHMLGLTHSMRAGSGSGVNMLLSTDVMASTRNKKSLDDTASIRVVTIHNNLLPPPIQVNGATTPMTGTTPHGGMAMAMGGTTPGGSALMNHGGTTPAPNGTAGGGAGGGYHEQFSRRAAKVNQLEFRLRELRKSTDTTQRELDEAHNEMHVAYLEQEYQQMRRYTQTATGGSNGSHGNGNGNGHHGRRPSQSRSRVTPLQLPIPTPAAVATNGNNSGMVSARHSSYSVHLPSSSNTTNTTTTIATTTVAAATTTSNGSGGTSNNITTAPITATNGNSGIIRPAPRETTRRSMVGSLSQVTASQVGSLHSHRAITPHNLVSTLPPSSSASPTPAPASVTPAPLLPLTLPMTVVDPPSCVPMSSSQSPVPPPMVAHTVVSIPIASREGSSPSTEYRAITTTTTATAGNSVITNNGNISPSPPPAPVAATNTNGNGNNGGTFAIGSVRLSSHPASVTSSIRTRPQ